MIFTYRWVEPIVRAAVLQSKYSATCCLATYYMPHVADSPTNANMKYGPSWGRCDWLQVTRHFLRTFSFRVCHRQLRSPF